MYLSQIASGPAGFLSVLSSSVSLLHVLNEQWQLQKRIVDRDEITAGFMKKWLALMGNSMSGVDHKSVIHSEMGNTSRAQETMHLY